MGPLAQPRCLYLLCPSHPTPFISAPSLPPTQECPTSGLLLSEMIRMAPRPSQKAKSTDALKKNASDPFILATIAGMRHRL